MRLSGSGFEALNAHGRMGGTVTAAGSRRDSPAWNFGCGSGGSSICLVQRRTIVYGLRLLWSVGNVSSGSGRCCSCTGGIYPGLFLLLLLACRWGLGETGLVFLVSVPQYLSVQFWPG